MEQDCQNTRQRNTAPFAWFIAAASAFAALAFGLTSLTAKPQATTHLPLPKGISAQTCMAVAKNAHLVHQRMTGARVGSYYAAWVEQLGGDKPTRSTLFNAGIAVAVCLR